MAQSVECPRCGMTLTVPTGLAAHGCVAEAPTPRPERVELEADRAKRLGEGLPKDPEERRAVLARFLDIPPEVGTIEALRRAEAEVAEDAKEIRLPSKAEESARKDHDCKKDGCLPPDPLKDYIHTAIKTQTAVHSPKWVVPSPESEAARESARKALDAAHSALLAMLNPETHTPQQRVTAALALVDLAERRLRLGV